MTESRIFIFGVSLIVGFIPLACSTNNPSTPSVDSRNSSPTIEYPTSTNTSVPLNTYTVTNTPTLIPTNAFTSTKTFTPTPGISPTITGTITPLNILVQVTNNCGNVETFVNGTPTIATPAPNAFEWQVTGPGVASNWVTNGSAQVNVTTSGTYTLTVVWGTSQTTGPPTYNVYQAWGPITQVSPFTWPGLEYGNSPGSAGGFIDCSNQTSYGSEGPF